MEQINSYDQQAEIIVDGFEHKMNISLLICSLALGLLFNLLFYDKPLGLSYPLYTIALYFALFWTMYKNKKIKLDLTWLLGISTMALSFSYLFFSNQIFMVLNFLIIPVLFIAHTLLLTSNNRFKWFESGFLVDLIYGIVIRPLENSFKPFSFLSNRLKKRTGSGKYSVAGKVLAGLLLTIPLLFVIVPLLASADDVFKYSIEVFTNVFNNISIDQFIIRLFIVVIVTCLVFSYLWSLFYSKSRLPEETSEMNLIPKLGAFIDPVTVTTLLVLIDALYIFFIAIQFSYLFGSLTNHLPNNLTYAQYARKGFFELVAVTVINLGILIGNINFVKYSGSKIDKIVKVLNTILVVSTFIMLLSAHFRMSLYEQAYGFTYLRVLTHAFMGYLFILFVVSLAKIWRQSIPLLKSYIIISIVAYSLINYINVDKIIVKNNIARYNEGKAIDLKYLTRLSYDAVPDLVDLMNTTSDQELARELKNRLNHKKEALKGAASWQSFNISKYRANEVLSEQDLHQAGNKVADLNAEP